MSEMAKQVHDELTVTMSQVLDDGGTEPAWEAWARGWLAGSPRARSREATMAALRVLEAAAKFRDAMSAGDVERDMPGYSVEDWRSLQSRLCVTEAAMCLARDLWGGAREATAKVPAVGKMVPGAFRKKAEPAAAATP